MGLADESDDHPRVALATLGLDDTVPLGFDMGGARLFGARNLFRFNTEVYHVAHNFRARLDAS